MVALLLLSFECLVSVNVLWLFLAMPWVGLQCVAVVFPDNTYFLCILLVQCLLKTNDQGAECSF